MAKYDFVIVGSGLGGLGCAYILSKEGYSVCVLEKNRQIGGSLQIFVRDRAIFDTGIHYIGGLSEGQNLNQYFRYLDIMDKLNLRKMDEDGFDTISFNTVDQEFKYAQGWGRFEERMVDYFPKEKEGIAKYCEMIREVCREFPMYNLRKSELNLTETKFLDIDAEAFIATCTNDELLRSVLAGSNPLYAGEGDKTPLYVHALVSNTYVESAWKCVNGGGQIAKYMVANIKGNGGAVRNYCDVRKLEVAGNEVKYALLSDGEKIEGKNFISNIHPSLTLDMLTGGKLRNAYVNRIHSLKNTISIFCLHLVMKPESFPYLNTNYYHYKTTDIWNSLKYNPADWPDGYALFCPATSKSEKYADGLTAMMYMDINDMKPWINTYNTIPKNQNDRGAGYEDFKMQKAEKMIDLLEQKFPDIRNCIRSYSTSSPLSYRDYMGTKDGSLYGIVKDYKNPLRTFISPKMKIPNLFLTGQNLNLHGVLGVTIGAVVTCGEILGTDYLLSQVKKS
ncbi:MAG TPA: NAD(P)/FAD-dependent oxidoreductase [Flavobacteriales bacterium]|nr:NAD(P)/FAD-dependent oxidoreductase [Flavobacteriales bacterium]HIA10866.1 NAD(P)/FAD-dependent oxidoreductase [Flavobacteriales bacterium]HIO72203.1 NAD(P)/FAD-dependent oxidoreductase [Flavobacteriales bacterium]